MSVPKESQMSVPFEYLSTYLLQPLLGSIWWIKTETSPGGLYNSPNLLSPDECKVIALDIPRRSGKSWLCVELAYKLGPEKSIIVGRTMHHVDRILRPMLERKIPLDDKRWRMHSEHSKNLLGAAANKVVIVDDAKYFKDIDGFLNNAIFPQVPECVVLIG